MSVVEEDIKIVSDEGKVSQILRNFISNALKFTERGEVRISAQLDTGLGTIRFEVRDTGIGIAPEDIEKIWEEFGQVQNKIQTKVKGTGLGLPLSKKLAELLGGTVSVESAQGEGSVFSLTLPVHFGTTEDKIRDEDWEVDPDRIPVLVLDDDAADSFGVERALAYSRYQAVTTHTIDMARQCLGKVKPAAILLDVMLRKEESWRFLSELRRRDDTRHIPVIVITSTQEEQKAMSLGADGFMEKPVDAHKLVMLLDEHTGSHSVTKVLLVDDEEISRYLVGQLLPRGAFELKTATNALDGLQRLKETIPDVVVFDLNMPSIDGFQFLDLISQSGDLSRLPAIAITSMTVDDKLRQRLSRANRVVSKYELTTETLVGAIKQVVEEGAVHG